jgi:hypothetical protein
MNKHNLLALIGAVCVIIWSFCLVSCGNKAIISPGNYSFTHIHFTDMTKGHCATIEKWWDNEEGIEVKTKEYGYLYCSEGSYILFESGNKCPYCK